MRSCGYGGTLHGMRGNAAALCEDDPEKHFWGGGSSHDKLPELAHQKALEKSLGIKDQSCPVLRLRHKTVW